MLDVEAVVVRHPGARGVRRLHQILPLVGGGAESLPESWNRLASVDAGFPVQRTQIVICGPASYLIARLDMGWEQWRVGVEYDGAYRWTDPGQRTRDIDRWAEVAGRGLGDRPGEQRLAEISSCNAGAARRRRADRRGVATMTTDCEGRDG